MLRSLVGSEMCIRDSPRSAPRCCRCAPQCLVRHYAADDAAPLLRPGSRQWCTRPRLTVCHCCRRPAWDRAFIDDRWLAVGEKCMSGGVDPLLIGLNDDSLVLCSISERILSRSLLWSFSNLLCVWTLLWVVGCLASLVVSCQIDCFDVAIGRRGVQLLPLLLSPVP